MVDGPKIQVNKRKTGGNSNKQENEQHHEDPFNAFGFGIVAYFNMLQALIGAFMVMSLLAGINIYMFSKENGLPVGSKGEYAYDLTLGNFGFSTSNCIVQFLNLDKKSALKCVRGKIKELTYAGIIMDYQSDPKMADGKSIEADYCGDPSKFARDSNCQNYLQPNLK